MEYRQLVYSGLKVPVLSFGCGTFGGKGDFFSAWGNTDVQEATRLVDICLEAGLNFFDTADVYSQGASEEILGKAIASRRNSVLISTKATFPIGDGPNDVGSSRYHLIQACEASLRRLNTDYIDVYHLHGFDAFTPVEEALKTLNLLVQSGKVRYIACSNFSGWHLMKSLAVSERYGWERYVAHQAYYSLVGRDFTTPDCSQHRHRCPQRRTTPSEPQRRRMEPDSRTSRPSGCRQRRDAALSVLAPASVHGEKSAADGVRWISRE